ncbi:MazG-like pyrophosphatase [Vibrio phage K381]
MKNKTPNPLAGTELEAQLDMLPATYPQLAMRTNKPGKELHMDKEMWQTICTGIPMIMEGCMKADRFKASLVYGAKNRDYAYSAFPALKYKLLPNELELLHAILGIISEGGELLQMFYDRKSAGLAIDRTNAVEEGGDLQWFLQLLAKSQGSTMEEMMQMNIKKLAARFPEGYSDGMGLVRDQENERKVLEQSEGAFHDTLNPKGTDK